MMTWVIGFPVGLWIGMALTSILEDETGCNSGAGCFGSSLLRAGLVVVSLDGVLCGIFLISLYLD